MSIKVDSKSKAPACKQGLGIKEVKDSSKMKFLLPNGGIACRVVFKPAT